MLSDRQHEFLCDESIRSGLSMAELVRRAIDSVYRPAVRPRAQGFELSVGVWRDPDPGLIGRRVRAVRPGPAGRTRER
ncbi:MAG: hypothetical protein QOK13_2250 [Gaiellaceae bacterium]|jgi:hypothetical protein|nr:hypothetical protein [Gaiellaceae bacterium]